jgi:hypothetical protein
MLNKIVIWEYVIVTFIISSNVFTTYYVYPLLPDLVQTYGDKNYDYNYQLIFKGLYLGVLYFLTIK